MLVKVNGLRRPFNHDYLFDPNEPGRTGDHFRPGLGAFLMVFSIVAICFFGSARFEVAGALRNSSFRLFN